MVLLSNGTQASTEDFDLSRMRRVLHDDSFKRMASPFLKNLLISNSSASSSSIGDRISMESPSYTFRKDNTSNAMDTKRTRYMLTPKESSNVLDLHESLLSQRKAMHSSYAGGDSLYSLPECGSPDFLEDIDSDSSESKTGSSDTEEDTDDDIPLLSGARCLSERHNSFSRQMSAEDESTSSEEDHYEPSISVDSSYLYLNGPDHESRTVSRNMHNLPRRSARKREMHSNQLEDKRYCEYRRKASGQKPMCYGSDFNGTSDETDDTDPNDRLLGDRMIGSGYDDYQLSTMVASRFKNIFSHDMLDWDDDPWEGRICMKNQCEEKLEGLCQEFDASDRHFGRKMLSPLTDVDLDVRGSYQKGHVPFVSLMSKLNGRAIIGHSVEIQVLAYGSAESYTQTMDYFSNETTYPDKPVLLPSAWKTARRRNSRVPRLNPSSPSLKANNDNNLMRRYSSPRMSQPPGERKQQQQQQKKLVKNTNATPSQKTRALSSFSSEQGNNVMSALQDRTHDLSNRRVLPGPPTVVCIPVKLVFSRLLEKLNRQPSITREALLKS